MIENAQCQMFWVNHIWDTGSGRDGMFLRSSQLHFTLKISSVQLRREIEKENKGRMRNQNKFMSDKENKGRMQDARYCPALDRWTDVAEIWTFSDCVTFLLLIYTFQLVVVF